MFKKPLERSEAILLSSTSYGEEDALVKAFSKDRGLLPLFIQKAHQKKKKIFLDLSHVEILYQESQGHFFKGKETTLINPFFEVRKNYDCLMTAFDMAETILTSQLPEKPAPLLFDLLLYCLKKIPRASDPWTLAASFKLKTLLYEGMFKISPSCPLCENRLNKSYLQEGQLVCPNCKKGSLGALNEAETKILLRLAFCKTFSDIEKLLLPPGWMVFVKNVFLEKISV